jgi:hypothetical protein
VANPAYPSPQPYLNLYTKQKDTTFGDNIYQYTYYADDDSFIVTQQNVDSISYGPIPIVAKNNLRSCVALLDAGAYILVYMVTLGRASEAFAAKQYTANYMAISINYRADALFVWFTRRADLSYKR